MKRPSKSTQVIEPKARAIIFGHGRGWVFTPRDLTRLGDPRSVGVALTRLSRKGVIRQLARGLYDYPIDHPALGRVAASADAVAKALVSRDSVRLQPAGAYAANVLTRAPTTSKARCYSLYRTGACLAPQIYGSLAPSM
jgi:hypothetical protein